VRREHVDVVPRGLAKTRVAADRQAPHSRRELASGFSQTGRSQTDVTWMPVNGSPAAFPHLQQPKTMIRTTLATFALITLAATPEPRDRNESIYLLPHTIFAPCTGCVGSLASDVTEQPASRPGCVSPSFVGSSVQGPTDGDCASKYFTSCDAKGECSYSINVEVQFPGGSTPNCFPEIWVEGGGIDPNANRLVNSKDFGTQTSTAKCKTGDTKEEGNTISIALYSDSDMRNEVGYFERQVQCTHCNRDAEPEPTTSTNH